MELLDAGSGARVPRINGAAQESNLPSRGLHDRTGFEDQLGHRAHAAPWSAMLASGCEAAECLASG